MYPEPIMADAVAVEPIEIKLSVAIYPSSSTLVSTSDIDVSITSSSYSNNSHFS